VLAPGLGGLDVLTGQAQLLGPRPRPQHLEPGPRLVDLRLDSPELGAIVPIGEPDDQLARGDPLPLVDVDLGDDPVDLRTHVRVVARSNREVTRNRERPRYE